ncbi:hypothetical protein [Hydrogenophaga sp. T2]|uniref:hypothetical protein n=1 Tax=Hydrogenophaga sp. T2 TaxID=3132823 RepID=UPI003CF0E5E1
MSPLPVRHRLRALCGRHGPALLACACACACGPAQAVFTFFPLDVPRTILLQVGASGATVNTVGFNVTGAQISPSPTPVSGVPDALTPGTSPAGGVRVRMRGQWGSGNQNLVLTVNSAAGLACVPGSGCGSTMIPFTTVGWIAHDKDSNAASDIQSGSFSGSASQTLVSVLCCGPGSAFGSSYRSVEIANTLVFTYSNATLYPAGRYRGTVTFTATLQ